MITPNDIQLLIQKLIIDDMVDELHQSYRTKPWIKEVIDGLKQLHYGIYSFNRIPIIKDSNIQEDDKINVFCTYLRLDAFKDQMNAVDYLLLKGMLTLNKADQTHYLSLVQHLTPGNIGVYMWLAMIRKDIEELDDDFIIRLKSLVNCCNVQIGTNTLEAVQLIILIWNKEKRKVRIDANEMVDIFNNLAVYPHYKWALLYLLKESNNLETMTYIMDHIIITPDADLWPVYLVRALIDFENNNYTEYIKSYKALIDCYNKHKNILKFQRDEEVRLLYYYHIASKETGNNSKSKEILDHIVFSGKFEYSCADGLLFACIELAEVLFSDAKPHEANRALSKINIHKDYLSEVKAYDYFYVMGEKAIYDQDWQMALDNYKRANVISSNNTLQKKIETLEKFIKKN